jgi:hypothetical protein
MFVQFSDATKTTIVSIFDCAQDPLIYPNQDEITAGDARYVSYFAALPEEAQRHLPPSDAEAPSA